MAWLWILVPVGIGFLLGVAVPVRKPVVLLLPAVALGVVLWIAWGWLSDLSDSELGREGTLVLTGIFAGAGIALWAVGVALGRYLRAILRAGGV